MRTLQLGKFYPVRGGVEKVIRDLAEGLAKEGVSCDMLCACLPDTVPDDCDVKKAQREGKDLVISLDGPGRIICVPALCFVAATMIAPRLVFRLRKMLREAEKEGNPYNIVHIHHPDPMAALALMLSGYRGKVVLHWHSDILKQKTLLKIIMPIQRWLVQRADLIVGTSPVYVRNSPHLKGVRDKLAFLPIGVREQPDSPSVSEIRNRYGCGKKLVFSLGRLVGYKGFEYLIDAAQYLGEDYQILIGGSGPLHEQLQARIDSKGLSGIVHLLGRVPDEDLPSYFRASDVFVLSSIWKTEAFAIVQLEAMSCGKPVVATKIPDSGVSWVNEDGVSGLNVPIEDARSIAEAIGKIVGDKSDYEHFCLGARKRYETMFTYDKMIKECMHLYDSVLGNED